MDEIPSHEAFDVAEAIIDIFYESMGDEKTLADRLVAQQTITASIQQAIDAATTELTEALRDLYDEQNGPPLLQARKKAMWDAAMAKAAHLLGLDKESIDAAS